MAYGKNATESGIFERKGFSTPACAAVNGRTGNVYIDTGDKNCAHTTNASGSWWLVDLGRNYTITDVTIYTRTGNLLTNRGRKDECECVGAGGGGGWKGGGEMGRVVVVGDLCIGFLKRRATKKIDINDMVGKYWVIPHSLYM